MTATTAPTQIARFRIPGTTAIIAIVHNPSAKTHKYTVIGNGPLELGGHWSSGRRNEIEARATANYHWRHVVGLRNKAGVCEHGAQAATCSQCHPELYPQADQQVPGLPGVTYGDAAAAFSDTGAEPDYTADYRRDANLAAATGTHNPRYAGVREARTLAAAALATLATGHDKFRVAVQLDPADKLRFFQLDVPQRGKWVGCVFTKEQAGDDLHKVRDIVREEAVLRAVVADARGALARYGLELGHCGMCGRTLTDEESRARGIGPVCADKL